MQYKFEATRNFVIRGYAKGIATTVSFSNAFTGPYILLTSNESVANIVRMSDYLKKGFIKETTKAQAKPQAEEKPAPKTQAPVEEPAVEGETIAAEDVSTFMDAKSYLKDVLHIDPALIRTKNDCKAYCEEHGIFFANYSFE